MMGLNGADLMDEGDRIGGGGGGDGGCGIGGGEVKVLSETVSCSICLDAVNDDEHRSRAKLQCGHEFHLDCIGSAFNVKGAMQCPNCRKTEKGQWLYATGFHSLHEYNIDDISIDEDLYDPSYSEMSIGVHWCPFNGLAQFPSLFDEGEISSNTYNELLGQRPIFAEHASTSTTTHSSPYIAYFGTVHPSSSTSSATVSDVSNFNGHWNGAPHPSEIPASYAFPGMDVHMNTWDHHSPLFPASSSHIVGAEQTSVPSVSQRARSGSFIQPFVVGHSAAARSGTSAATSMIPPYPGSAARARDRVQALQAYFQQPSNSPSVVSGSRRSSSHNRSMAQVGTVAPPSDQANGFYFFPPSTSGRAFQEPDNRMSNRFLRSREREQHFTSYPSNQLNSEAGWSPFFQPGAGSEAGMRYHNLRQRHESEWWQSQNQS